MRNAPTGEEYLSIRCEHIPGNKETYPLWLASYWVEIPTIRKARKHWDDAVHALEVCIERNPSDTLALRTLERILSLPWDTPLRGFHESDSSGLVNFCIPTAWLKTSQINQMLELMDDDRWELDFRGIRVVPSDHAARLVSIYNVDGLGYETSPRHHDLRELGEAFAGGFAKLLATVANVDEDHWVAIVVDFVSRKTSYWDSAKRPICTKIRAAYDWWFHQHHGTEFEWKALPSVLQLDGHNCGLVATNRIAHYIDPHKYPLLDPKACSDERLRILGRILDRHETTSFPHIAKDFVFTFRYGLADND
ncbi:hypothetical protein GGX14DRAFT_380144, partial [Mycena pura]